MAANHLLDSLIAPLRADVVSGAAVVARMAAEAVNRGAARLPADDVAGFRRAMSRLAAGILDAQPAMAPLVSLLASVLTAIEGAPDLDAARTAAAAAATRFRTGLHTRARILASRAAALLEPGTRVLTVSSSSTVKAALLHAGPEAGLRVICLEGRPAFEGRLLAAALAAEGFEVTLAVDAAVSALTAECDLVLVGADSIGDAGLVNKIGTAPAVDAAVRLGVPVHVLTDESKILPRGFPQPLDDDRPPEEVARELPGVRIWNRYFEAVELARVTAVVTENATLTHHGVEALRRGLTVPVELRRWAEARR